MERRIPRVRNNASVSRHRVLSNKRHRRHCVTQCLVWCFPSMTQRNTDRHGYCRLYSNHICLFHFAKMSSSSDNFLPDPEILDDVYFCRHCKDVIPTLDNVQQHACFEGKEVFLEGKKELYSPAMNNISLKNKEAAAVWTTEATLALLSLYEANMGMLDHPKKKTKIWLAIADGLRDLKIEMSPQQVRWKMNALTKRYKECVDNNSKTGRGTVEFQWFDQLDEIFGDKNNAGPAYTVSSKLCFPMMTSKNKASNVAAINEQSEDREKEKKQLCKSHFKMKNEEHAVLEEICPPLDIAANKQTEDITSTMQLKTDEKLRVKRATHGTGSNIAKSKIELGKQWHQHLQDKIKREAIKEKQYDNMMRKKEEILQLKQKQIELKEKELQQKKTIASNKMKDKEKRHAEILSLERKKCKLFRAFLKKDTGNTSPKYYSDSSN